MNTVPSRWGDDDDDTPLFCIPGTGSAPMDELDQVMTPPPPPPEHWLHRKTTPHWETVWQEPKKPARRVNVNLADSMEVEIGNAFSALTEEPPALGRSCRGDSMWVDESPPTAESAAPRPTHPTPQIG